jgi:hypothetical protein
VEHLEVRKPQKEQKIDIAVENSALHASMLHGLHDICSIVANGGSTITCKGMQNGTRDAKCGLAAQQLRFK